MLRDPFKKKNETDAAKEQKRIEQAKQIFKSRGRYVTQKCEGQMPVGFWYPAYIQ